MVNESSNILNKVRDLDLNEAKLLQFYEQMPVRKHEEMLILGKALYAISNNFLKLGIAHSNTLIAEVLWEKDPPPEPGPLLWIIHHPGLVS